MKISRIYEESKKPVLSCEFFAPKTVTGFQNLYKVFNRLKEISPGFFSVTYGAGGSTARPTLDLVSKIQDEYGVTAMPHLTCVNHSKKYLEEYIYTIRQRGIENILALRGDMPGGGKFVPHPDGLNYASEVVELAGKFEHFSVGVAGHPEGHPDSISIEEDLLNLKKKLDAGANFVITQFFFNNDYYFKFVESAKAIGIDKPIIPGVIPFVNSELVMRFAKMNHTKIPVELHSKMLEAGSDKDKSTTLGVEQATAQCTELLESGVPGIHFYTLNNSKPSIAVIKELDL